MSILSSALLLGGIGCVGAAVLGGVARKFRVEEDPRIGEVEQQLAGANCGGCGFKGCHDFAVNCVKCGSLDGMYCPVGGADTMAKISSILGLDAVAADKKIAVVRCEGTPQTKSPLTATYSGPRRCAIMAFTAGDYRCANSCLGCGDCVSACRFDAIVMDADKGLPVVDADKCTGCGMCAKACPRAVIEMRPFGLRGRRVWVACGNCMKGPKAREQCSVSCIGCGICAKTCPFDAITVNNYLAYIDPAKCRTCGKCIPVCPQHCISHSFEIKVATT